MSSFSSHACFNELSFEKISALDKQTLFENYVRTIKALKNKGFDAIRYEHGVSSLISDGWSVFQLQGDSRTRDLFRIILSSARNPYISSSEVADEKKNCSLGDYEVNVDGEWIHGDGFSAAHVLDTVVVSLDSHPKWHERTYSLRTSADENVVGVVLNTYSDQSVDADEISRHVENRTPVELTESRILPEAKKYHFRKDHGMDLLIALWNRLMNCPYVVSAINSLEFNPTGQNFIEKCFEDGKINIRITDSDAGYGMVIQTTGSDLRSTKAIAKIIAEKYS